MHLRLGPGITAREFVPRTDFDVALAAFGDYVAEVASQKSGPWVALADKAPVDRYEHRLYLLHPKSGLVKDFAFVNQDGDIYKRGERLGNVITGKGWDRVAELTRGEYQGVGWL